MLGRAADDFISQLESSDARKHRCDCDRKLVEISKTINSAPQYTLRIKSWKFGGKHAGSFFRFEPTKGMTQLGADQLVSLDGLPPESAPGVDQ